MSDVVKLVGRASAAMADCALAMKIAGEKAVVAAEAFEAAAEAHEKLGLNSETYRDIAALFRGIEAQNQSMEFDELVRVCLFHAEACGT